MSLLKSIRRRSAEQLKDIKRQQPVQQVIGPPPSQILPPGPPQMVGPPAPPGYMRTFQDGGLATLIPPPLQNGQQFGMDQLSQFVGYPNQ